MTTLAPRRKNSSRIVVLGGYGFLGQRIAHALAAERDLEVIVAGRSVQRAARAVETIRSALPGCKIEAAELDILRADFAPRLAELEGGVLVNTAGPFQCRDYAVGRAAIDAQMHAVDVADARGYVLGIDTLHAAAQDRDVLHLSGASSVPALAAAVVDHLLPLFARLDSIDHGVTAANRTSQGEAAVASVLSYCGKPFERWEHGAWHLAYGWQDLRRRRYPERVGVRWLANCDVPDLALFPQRYPSVQTVKFQAGFDSDVLDIGLWLLAKLARAGWIANCLGYAPLVKRVSNLFRGLGSDAGGMHVELRGARHDGQPLALAWTLCAGSGHGGQIPCVPAIVLAKKLARGNLAARGAMACMGLFTLDEFFAELKAFDVSVRVEPVL
jgi:NAD(P)-dependent dehydrogenase (short-subunit alcohol dehydrogenase family)